MFRQPRRIVRRLRRFARPVVTLALVLGQCVATFGYPVVVHTGESIRRCGCKVRGPSETCCCGPRACCEGAAEKAIPEPEEPACPMCKRKSAAKPAAPASLTWLAGVKARQCHGDGPLGLIAEFPSIPPDTSSRPLTQPVPVDVVRVSNDRLTSHVFVPPDPPPRG